MLSKVVSCIYLCQACFTLTSAQVFSHTDLITDSEHFYTSILDLLDDTDEKDEVDQLRRPKANLGQTTTLGDSEREGRIGLNCLSINPKRA